MLGRAVLVAALFLFAGFAGCIGKSNNGDAVNAESAKKSGTIDPNQTAQPNGAQISAFKETNKTETTGMGALMHSHDYWGQETRKVIWSQHIGLIPLPLMPDGKPTGTAIADFNISEHKLVYEGASEIDLLLTNMSVAGNPGGHPHVSAYFDYLTASDEPGAFRTGGQLVENQPFKLNVKPTEADMPHSTNSLWVFRIYSGEANAMDFDLQATAVKGYSIVNWPPHPNLYADKTTRTVFDGPVKEGNSGTVQVNIDGKDVQWLGPERVISWGTDSVDVTVDNVQFSTQGPAPDGWLLEYHNATHQPLLGNGDQAGGRAFDKGSDMKTWHFTIPVDSDGMDSPYGQKSRWGFRFVPRFQSDPTGCYSEVPGPSGTGKGPAYGFVQEFLIGCQFTPWSMSYHMTIVAHGHSTALGVDTTTPQTTTNTTGKS